jgi:hypothetical protein
MIQNQNGPAKFGISHVVRSLLLVNIRWADGCGESKCKCFSDRFTQKAANILNWELMTNEILRHRV